jgi:flagellar biosynthesis/type III secretory pathway chaperone
LEFLGFSALWTSLDKQHPIMHMLSGVFAAAKMPLVNRSTNWHLKELISQRQPLGQPLIGT